MHLLRGYSKKIIPNNIDSQGDYRDFNAEFLGLSDVITLTYLRSASLHIVYLFSNAIFWFVNNEYEHDSGSDKKKIISQICKFAIVAFLQRGSRLSHVFQNWAMAEFFATIEIL